MRKELPGTYTELKNGDFEIKARTSQGEIIQYSLKEKDLILDVDYVDKQGRSRQGRVFLKPVVAQVWRVDTLLPSDLHLYYLASLNCYSGLQTEDLIAKAKSANEQEINQFLRENIIPTGHWSIIEHRGPSFLIEGISRACSHQFVRHRLLSFSQQSQRYVDSVAPSKLEKEEMIFPFVIPPSIRAQPDLIKEFLSGLKESLKRYYFLRANNVFPEDARFLLPNATATRLVVSGNRRVWLELIPKRTCGRAQWEIDIVISEIARQLWEEMPVVFQQAGPPCSGEKCNQGKRSCGLPLKKPLSAFFNDPVYPHDKLIFGAR